jgi:hypothetical protein
MAATAIPASFPILKEDFDFSELSRLCGAEFCICPLLREGTLCGEALPVVDRLLKLSPGFDD